MCQDMSTGLGGVNLYTPFLKPIKQGRQNGFLLYESFDSAHKLKYQKLPPYEAFFSKLRNNNPLDNDFRDYQKLGSSELDEQQALMKLQVKKHQVEETSFSNVFFVIGEKRWILLWLFQCDLIFPDQLKSKLANFPSNLKN